MIGAIILFLLAIGLYVVGGIAATQMFILISAFFGFSSFAHFIGIASIWLGGMCGFSTFKSSD